ncbi:MAG: amidohydrolase family protein, partial [Vicinamibacterales bacterium]
MRGQLILSIVAILSASLAAIAARVPQVPPEQPADLVLTNGRIITLESPAEAGAIASRGSRIVAIGSSAEVRKFVGPQTEVIELRGQTVIPGFVEGHGHFVGVGQSRLQLNLMKAASWDEIVTMVEQAVKEAKPGQWIYGRGWHQEKWRTTPTPNVEGFPTHESLSRVSPRNPVLLTHASGHATFANARAMELSDVMA